MKFRDVVSMAPGDAPRVRSKDSGYGQNALSQEIEAGAAIHGALDKLQAINLALDLTLSPMSSEGGQDRVLIGHQIGEQTL